MVSPPIKQPRGLLIQGWHYIILYQSEILTLWDGTYMEHSNLNIWNHCRLMKKINHFLVAKTHQYYHVSPWFMLWVYDVYGGNFFGEATREATRVKRHSPSTPWKSCSPKNDKPWNAIKISICRLHPVFLPLDMHLFKNAEITPRLIAISMGNLSFSNPVESYLAFSNMLQVHSVTVPNLYGFVSKNRLPPKFDVDHLIICWSSVDHLLIICWSSDHLLISLVISSISPNTLR